MTKKRDRKTLVRPALGRAPIGLAPGLAAAVERATQQIQAALKDIEVIRLRALMAAGITDADSWTWDPAGSPVLVYQQAKTPRPAAALPVAPPPPPAEPPPPASVPEEPDPESQGIQQFAHLVRGHKKFSEEQEAKAAAAEGGA